MIASSNEIENINTLITFSRPEHESLGIGVLKAINTKIDFKLKIQKASIQLINSGPFAVIAFRRSQNYIFIEFYSQKSLKHTKLIKSTLANNGLWLNRFHIRKPEEINEELVELIIRSSRLISD